MKETEVKIEPLCETSEANERLVSGAQLLPVSLEFGRRLAEVFGYQSISAIVFRLKFTADEVRAVINGEKMPSAEMLLSIQRTIGASIDWLLTGEGPKWAGRTLVKEGPYDSMPLAVFNVQRESQPRLYIKRQNQ